MNADELARVLYAEGQKWRAAHGMRVFGPWEKRTAETRDLYVTVAAAVLRELECPAPLVVDAGGKDHA